MNQSGNKTINEVKDQNCVNNRFDITLDKYIIKMFTINEKNLSAYFSEKDYYCWPIVDFSDFDDKGKKLLGTINVQDLKKSCEVIIDEIKQNEKLPKYVLEYFQKLSEYIPEESYPNIAKFWPPVLTDEGKNNLAVAFLIKFLCELSKKGISSKNFFTEILNKYFFKSFWSQDHKNQELTALALCENGQIAAYSYKESLYRLYGKSNGVWEVKNEVKNVRYFSKDKGKRMILVKEAPLSSKRFTPMNKDHVNSWYEIFAVRRKDEVMNNGTNIEVNEDDNLNEDDYVFIFNYIPFVRFLIDGIGISKLPDEVLPKYVQTFYRLVNSDNGLIPRAILLECPSYSLIRDLVMFFSYSGNLSVLIGTAVGLILDKLDDRGCLKIFSEDSFFRKFIFAYYERFAKLYVSEFLSKLADFVQEIVQFDEKSLFTITKYIMDSYNLLPYELRLLYSIVRQYSLVKDNSRLFTYQMIGGVFGLDLICRFLDNPHVYIPGMVIKNEKSLKEASRLLEYIFKGYNLPSEYQSFNKRLNKKVFSKMEDFLFHLGDYSDDKKVYRPPNRNELSPSLQNIMNYIMSNVNYFIKQLDPDLDSNHSKPNPHIAWNFSCYMIDFFKQCYDEKCNKFYKAPSKRELLGIDIGYYPMYGVLAVNKASAPGSQTAFTGADVAHGAYDELDISPLMLHVPSMKLPTKPHSSFHNPLMKDESDMSESSLTAQGEREPRPSIHKHQLNIPDKYNAPKHIGPPPKSKQSISSPSLAGKETAQDLSYNTGEQSPKIPFPAQKSISRQSKRLRIPENTDTNADPMLSLDSEVELNRKFSDIPSEVTDDDFDGRKKKKVVSKSVKTRVFQTGVSGSPGRVVREEITTNGTHTTKVIYRRKSKI